MENSFNYTSDKTLAVGSYQGAVYIEGNYRQELCRAARLGAAVYGITA